MNSLKLLRTYFFVILGCFTLTSGNITSLKTTKVIIGEEFLTSDSVMYWLEGSWSGEGFSYNNSIADDLEWHWALDHKFLNMKIVSTQGDSFKAEGYLNYLETDKVFQFYEFSNMTGVRWFRGDFKNNELLLNEMPDDKNMVVSFKFRNRNEFVLEEYRHTKDDIKILVSERFKRRK